MYKQDPSIYGYALIQKPYLVPVGTVGTASVYMSCYTTNYGTITANGSPTSDFQLPTSVIDPHYYVNGNFLAEAAERGCFEDVCLFLKSIISYRRRNKFTHLLVKYYNVLLGRHSSERVGQG